MISGLGILSYHKGVKMLEIELKVKISDFEAMRALLKTWGNEKLFEKKDLYFGLPPKDNSPGFTLFRLRKENTQWIVTSKKKSITDGIEVSFEREFIINDPLEFQNFAQDLGFIPFIKKEKLGYSYTKDNVKAELSRVTGLGSYLELEFLAPETCTEEEIVLYRNKLLDLLPELGLSKGDIEPRPYTKMLQEKGLGSV